MIFHIYNHCYSNFHLQQRLISHNEQPEHNKDATKIDQILSHEQTDTKIENALTQTENKISKLKSALEEKLTDGYITGQEIINVFFETVNYDNKAAFDLAKKYGFDLNDYISQRQTEIYQQKTEETTIITTPEQHIKPMIEVPGNPQQKILSWNYGGSTMHMLIDETPPVDQIQTPTIAITPTPSKPTENPPPQPQSPINPTTAPPDVIVPSKNNTEIGQTIRYDGGRNLDLSSINPVSVFVIAEGIRYLQDSPDNIQIGNNDNRDQIFTIEANLPNGQKLQFQLTRNIEGIHNNEVQMISQNNLTVELKNLGLIRTLDYKGAITDRVFRDLRLATLDGGIETAYISAQYVGYLIAKGDLQSAEEALKGGVNAAIKNKGRITRLYYHDGNEVEGAHSPATLGDASSFAISLGKYIHATINNPDDLFKQQAIKANQAIHEWINNLGRIKDKPYRVMSDRDTTYTNETGGSLSTQWTTAVSVENNARYAQALWENHDQNQAKILAQSLIDDSWDEITRQFASGITPKGEPTNEYARDALDLHIINAAKMGLIETGNEVSEEQKKLNLNNLNRLYEAYMQTPAYSLEDESFGYQGDFTKGVSVIPEFMYTDTVAGYILAQYLIKAGKPTEAQNILNKAKKHLEIANKVSEKINGAYSTEYVNAGVNAATIITQQIAQLSDQTATSTLIEMVT